MAQERRLITEDYIDGIDTSDMFDNGVDNDFSPEFIFGLDFSIMTKELMEPSSKVVSTHALFRKFFENFMPWSGRFTLTAECIWEEDSGYEGKQTSDVSQRDLIKLFKEVSEYCESQNITYMFVDYSIRFEVVRVPSFREFCSCINKLWENIVSRDCTFYVKRVGDNQMSRIPLISHQRLHYSFLSYFDMEALYSEMFKTKAGYKEPGPGESQQWYNETFVSSITKTGFMNTLMRLDKEPRLFRGSEMKVWGFQTGSEINSRSGEYRLYIGVKPDDGTTDSAIQSVKSLIGTINLNTASQLCAGRMIPVEMMVFCIVDDSVVMNSGSGKFYEEVKHDFVKMKFYISRWVPSIDGNCYRVGTNGNISSDNKISRKLIENYRELFEKSMK